LAIKSRDVERDVEPPDSRAGEDASPLAVAVILATVIGASVGAYLIERPDAAPVTSARLEPSPTALARRTDIIESATSSRVGSHF
jgi:hypothetical protein